MVIMRKVSVADLKARLSEYLSVVKQGEDVIVTEHGKPVARLTPLSGEAALDARMVELIRTGAVKPPTAKLSADFFRNRPTGPIVGDIVAELRAERDEGL